MVLEWAERAGAGRARALDLGCAVGRSTFEIARGFGEVVGIDISQTFVDGALLQLLPCLRGACRLSCWLRLRVSLPLLLCCCPQQTQHNTNTHCHTPHHNTAPSTAANRVKAERAVTYELKVEGDIGETVTAALDPAIDAGRCAFLQGDACALPPGLGEFDALLAANLLCRVPNPAACLDEMARSLRPGGVLVMTSPFTWLEEYTERAKWVGGRRDGGGEGGGGGGPLRCADALKAALKARGFVVLDEGRAPLVIRETARKYQLILAHRLVTQKGGRQ